MLVLTRKINERLIINGNIIVEVLGQKQGQVRIGISSPPEVTIDREEVHLRKLNGLPPFTNKI